MGALHRQSAAGRARSTASERMHWCGPSRWVHRWIDRTASDNVEHVHAQGPVRCTRRERKAAKAKLLRQLATGLPQATIYGDDGRGPRLSVRQEQIVHLDGIRVQEKAENRRASRPRKAERALLAALARREKRGEIAVLPPGAKLKLVRP